VQVFALQDSSNLLDAHMKFHFIMPIIHQESCSVFALFFVKDPPIMITKNANSFDALPRHFAHQ
jgi:hypothetical protein